MNRLEELQKRLYDLDEMIVVCLNQRTYTKTQLRRERKRMKLPPIDIEHEQRFNTVLRQMNPGPLRDRDLVMLYDTIRDGTEGR